MTTELSTDETAFVAAFNGERPEPAAAPAEPPTDQAPARQDDEPAPATEASDEQPPEQTEQPPEEDDPIALREKLRTALADIEALRKAAALVPALERRLNKAEGRIGDLNTRVPAPTPPAPPRLEKVERIRADLPEVAEAFEEMFAQVQKAAAPPQPEPSDDIDTSELDAEMPEWRDTVRGADFTKWLADQDQSYRAKVQSTRSPGVMLAALARFDAYRSVSAERQAAAVRAAQTRQSRAAQAVVPTSTARRAPTPELSEEELLMRGFQSQRL